MSSDKGLESIREDLALLLGPERPPAEVDELAEVACVLEMNWPRPAAERAESALERRNNLISLHRELFGKPVETAEGRKGRRTWVLASALVAAAAILVVLFIFIAVHYATRPAPVVAGKLIVQTGTATIRRADGTRLDVKDEANLKVGDDVVSGKDTMAEIRFEDGSVTRMDALSRVEIPGSNERQTVAVLMKGQCYSQAKEGSTHTTSTMGIRFRTNGGAENVSNSGDRAAAIAIRDQVLAAPPPGDGVIVREGEIVTFRVDPKAESGTSIVEQRTVSPRELATLWFRYNRAMDRKEGFDSGILNSLPEESLEEILFGNFPREQINIENTPGREKDTDVEGTVPDDGQPAETSATQPAPGTEPQPEPTPSTQPQPSPSTQPQPSPSTQPQPSPQPQPSTQPKPSK